MRSKLEMVGYNYTRQVLGDAKGYTVLVAGGGDVLLAQSADGETWKRPGPRPGSRAARSAGAA